MAVYVFTWSAVWWESAGSSISSERNYYADLLLRLPVAQLGVSPAELSIDSILYYQNTLLSGWPTANNILRVLVALLVLISAFVLSLVSMRVLRYRSYVLSAVVILLSLVLSVIVLILDARELSMAMKECREAKCPARGGVINSEWTCGCQVPVLFTICVAGVESLFVAILLVLSILIVLLVVKNPPLDGATGNPL